MKSAAKPCFRSLSSTYRAASAAAVGFFAAAALVSSATPQAAFAQKVLPPATPAVPVSGGIGDGSDLGLSPNAVAQIQAIYADKMQWTPAQQKLDSHLIYGIRKAQNLPMVPGQPNLVLQSAAVADAKGMIAVSINGTVSAAVLTAVTNAGGQVTGSFPQYGIIEARLPIGKVEALAGLADVRTITLPSPAIAKGPPLDVVTEGDADHRADVFRTLTGVTGLNIDGSGRNIKIGIISTGVKSYTNRASVNSGNLNTVTVLPGQAGPAGEDEGTAMLEIVRDLVPNADLYFATGFTGLPAFAANVLALKAAGCDIIIDDIGYRDEAPFQNDILAQAVNTVTANGAMFFSAAGNDGNLTAGTASVWEGDFTNGGRINIGVNPATQVAYGSIIVHRYSTGQPWNNVNIGGAQTVLNWSDPLAKSSNDYDIFLTNAAGTVVTDTSTTVQNGTQDPREAVGIFINNPTAAGSRVYIAATPAASTRVPPLPPNPIPPAQRALRLNLFGGGGQARAFTFVTNGNVYGHSAAGSAYSVSATPATVTNFSAPILFTATSTTEPFTVDGPRRLFYNDDGTLITNGAVPLFTNGAGNLLQKTDITAADGVTTSVFGFIPFFGTSAAAPHAGAIAGLIRSYLGMQSATFINGQLLTTVDTTLPTTGARINPSEMFLTLTGSAIDIGATGYDNVAGSGIVMPVNALNFLTNFVTTITVPVLNGTGATIKFNTNLPVTSLNAKVRVIPDALYQSSGGSLAGAVTFTESNVPVTPAHTTHTITVTGLTPGVKYDYFTSAQTTSGSVVYNEPAATLRTFTTPGVVVTPLPPSSGGIAIGTASAVRSGTDIIVTVSLINTSGVIANNVNITSGTLNGTATTTALPFMVGSGLYPGATLPAPLRFVYPASARGTTATVAVSGKYNGTATFSGGATVVIP